MYGEEVNILSLIMAWKKPNEDKFFVRGVTKRKARVTKPNMVFSQLMMISHSRQTM
jgi:hypothetical protein